MFNQRMEVIMYTRILRKIVVKLENSRNAHCSDSGGSGAGHCS